MEGFCKGLVDFVMLCKCFVREACLGTLLVGFGKGLVMFCQGSVMFCRGVVGLGTLLVGFGTHERLNVCY